MNRETKTIALLLLILYSGCAVKEEQNSKNVELKKVTYSPKYNTTPELKQRKILACVGEQCRASIFKNRPNTTSTRRVNRRAFYIKQSRIEPKPLIYTYQEYQKNIKIKRVDKSVAIQVGAFRRYAGAKVYARRYRLLNRRYKTVIKKGYKNSKPIYRVRILGFRNKQEARDFMYRYNLNDAFLVRR